MDIVFLKSRIQYLSVSHSCSTKSILARNDLVTAMLTKPGQKIVMFLLFVMDRKLTAISVTLTVVSFELESFPGYQQGISALNVKLISAEYFRDCRMAEPSNRY